MRINNNISALNANRNLGKVNTRIQRTMEKLSSGLRIARAADDSAGLAISEKLRGNIKGAGASARAAQDAISVAQVGEAALEEATSLLTRAKELKVQYTGTSDATAQTAIKEEMSQIAQEVTNVIKNTKFNGKNVFDNNTDLTYIADIESGAGGTLSAVALVAVDANGNITGEGTNSTVANQGLANIYRNSTGDNVATGEEMVTAHTAGANNVNIDKALDEVVTARSTFGSYQSRLESVVRSSNSMEENYQAAESRVRDADMATEMVKFTKDSIIQQAAQSMLTQANQLPQSIIGLLQN